MKNKHSYNASESSPRKPRLHIPKTSGWEYICVKLTSNLLQLPSYKGHVLSYPSSLGGSEEELFPSWNIIIWSGFLDVLIIFSHELLIHFGTCSRARTSSMNLENRSRIISILVCFQHNPSEISNFTAKYANFHTYTCAKKWDLAIGEQNRETMLKIYDYAEKGEKSRKSKGIFFKKKSFEGGKEKGIHQETYTKKREGVR